MSISGCIIVPSPHSLYSITSYLPLTMGSCLSIPQEQNRVSPELNGVPQEQNRISQEWNRVPQEHNRISQVWNGVTPEQNETSLPLKKTVVQKKKKIKVLSYSSGYVGGFSGGGGCGGGGGGC